MWRYLLAAAITAVIMVAIYGPRSGGSSSSTFQWSGTIAPQQWVHVHNITGRLRIEPADDDSVHVRANMRAGRRSRDVQIVVNEADGNLYVCPVAGGHGGCGPDGYSSGRAAGLRRLFGNRSKMHVDFTVQVPQGVFAEGSNTNGAVAISGIAGEARARTVNGRIDVSDVFGPVTARSTNGSIRVRLDSLPGGAPLSFRTTNGSITADLPGELAADVELATTNGRINSDYPITGSGEISSRRLRGRIGAGGREISIRTTNGSITLRPIGPVRQDAADANADANVSVEAGAPAAASAQQSEPEPR